MRLFDSMVRNGSGFSDLRRYVGDYKIVETKDDGGRLRKKAVYVGRWIVIRDMNHAVKARMWASLAAGAGLAIGYVRALLISHVASGQLLVMLPLLAGLFPLLYLIMGLLSLPFHGKPMRRDQYMHSFIRAFRSAVALGAFQLVGLLATFLFRLIQGDWLFLSGDWWFIISVVLTLILAAVIIILLYGIDLAEVENVAFDSNPL